MILTLSASKAILSFLQTMQIQVSQLVTSCLTWNLHCLAVSYTNIPKILYHENRSRSSLNMEESALNNSALKGLTLSNIQYICSRHLWNYIDINVKSKTSIRKILTFKYSWKHFGKRRSCSVMRNHPFCNNVCKRSMR